MRCCPYYDSISKVNLYKLLVAASSENVGIRRTQCAHNLYLFNKCERLWGTNVFRVQYTHTHVCTIECAPLGIGYAVRRMRYTHGPTIQSHNPKIKYTLEINEFPIIFAP